MALRGSVRSSIVPLLCLAALLPAPLPADPAANPKAPAKTEAANVPAQAETFFESVDVSVVNVDVYVADKGGKRVHGLKREDFELYEDGKPVPISNFYAEEGEPADTPPGTAGTPANPGGEANATPPTEQRLYLTLFIDQKSLTSPARNRLIPALKSFVAGRLRPGDRLLLANYNGAVQVQGPTGDPAVINAALDALAKTAPRGNEAMLDRRQLLSEVQEADDHDDPNRPARALEMATATYNSIRLFAQSQHEQVRATLVALGQFVDSLAGLPGRKAVLLVSGGLSQRPAEEIYQLWQNKFAQWSRQVGAGSFEAFRQDTGQLFQNMVERANASRATFYTIAAPEDLSGRSAEEAGNPNWSQDLAATAAVNQTQALQSLAAGTGGLAAVDTSKSLLDRLRGDVDSYYSLGYVPSHKKDGKKHQLAVKLRDRNLVVRSRESYRERTGVETTSARTLSALLLGEEVNPFEVSFAVEGESKDKKGQYQVTLLVKLPMSKLVLLPHGDAHEGRLRIFVGARDDEGRVSPINEIAVPIRVPNDQILTVLGQSAATRITLLLRPGQHRLAIGVRDELGNTDSTVTSSYTAGSLTDGASPAAAPATLAKPGAQ